MPAKNETGSTRRGDGASSTDPEATVQQLAREISSTRRELKEAETAVLAAKTEAKEARRRFKKAKKSAKELRKKSKKLKRALRDATLFATKAAAAARTKRAAKAKSAVRKTGAKPAAKPRKLSQPAETAEAEIPRPNTTAGAFPQVISVEADASPAATERQA